VPMSVRNSLLVVFISVARTVKAVLDLLLVTSLEQGVKAKVCLSTL